MAKRVNYGFGKRQKEIKRQKKKEAKEEKRRLKREAAVGGDQDEVTSIDDETTAVRSIPTGSDPGRAEGG